MCLGQLPRGTSWRAPSRVTDFIQLRRGPVARPTLSKLDRGRALQDLLRETMIVFRSRPFRSAPYPFGEYSEFILAAVAAGKGTLEVTATLVRCPLINFAALR